MYVKIVQSGDLIEKYIYEFEPARKTHQSRYRRRSAKRHTRRGDSLARLKRHFYRTVRANVFFGCPALLTLTMREVVGIDEANRAFTRFAHKLRRRSGNELSYLAVPEFQTRGAVHYHCLIWGLADEEIHTERKSRYLADLWSHGFVDIIETDGSPALAGYLSKYMSKSLHDPRLVGKKAFMSSRNVVRPVSLSTAFQVDIFEKEFPLDTVDNFALQVREYPTQWMGKCVYKQYQYYYARKDKA